MSKRIKKKKAKIERLKYSNYSNYFVCPSCGDRVFSSVCRICKNKVSSWKQRQILRITRKPAKGLRSFRINPLALNFFDEVDFLDDDCFEMLSLAMPRLKDGTPMNRHEPTCLEMELLI